MADPIDNTRSIVGHDPDFAVVYMREKRLLLDVLTKADPALREIAVKQLQSYEATRRATPRQGDGDTPTINEIIRAAQEVDASYARISEAEEEGRSIVPRGARAMCAE